jgi:hypothetical protein
MEMDMKTAQSPLSPAQPQVDSTGNSVDVIVALASLDAVSERGLETTEQTASSEHLKRTSSSYPDGNEAAGHKSQDRPGKKQRNAQTTQGSVSNKEAYEPKLAETADRDELDTSPICVQKGRALVLWKAVDVDDKLANVIKGKLEDGLVPPVFHVYCAVFQGKRAKGNVGVSKEAIELLRPEIPDGRDEESQPSEPIATITEGEAGTDTLSQKGFIKVKSFFGSDEKAIFEVPDDAAGKSWVFSKVWTAKVCALLNADAEMVGADVEVTKVDSHFNMGKVEDTSDAHLIMRRLSRGIVAKCLNMAPEDTLAIVGNPGIGKSWTLIYALQQLLLRKGACVLFSAQRVVLHWPVFDETAQCMFGRRI